MTTMHQPTLTLDANYEAMRRIGPWLAEQIGPVGAGHLQDRVGEFELAVHELAVNIVDHAFDDEARPTATFDISLACVEQKLIVRFVDGGHAYDTDDKPVITNEPTVRGYGLFILEQLAERIDYHRVGDENHWTLVFAP